MAIEEHSNERGVVNADTRFRPDETQEDFSRAVLTEVAAKVNAGALGPDVTATVSFAPRVRDAHGRPPADTLDTILAAILEAHSDAEELAVRAQLEGDVRETDNSIEFIRAEWKEWGASELLAARIGVWIARERLALAARAQGATAGSSTGAGGEEPLEPIEEDDGPEAEEPAFNGSLNELNRRLGEVIDPAERRRIERECGVPPSDPEGTRQRLLDALDDAAGKGLSAKVNFASGSGDTADKPRARRTDSTDPDAAKGPYASAGAMLCALKVARRAAPRKADDEPAVAFVVIAADPEHCRLIFSARDGRRWHCTFVDVSEPATFPTMQITLEKVSELADMLEFAAGRYPGASVRFRRASGSNLVWHIAYGEADRFEIELAEQSVEPTDWQPPRFSYAAPDVAALTTYDAKALTQATNWPGGGAIVSRDEADSSGCRHITLTTTSGAELLRAVIVPFGQTAGLPADRQQEINGTLSPPRAVGASKRSAPGASEPYAPGGPSSGKVKPIEPGTPAGPATLAPADGKWRLERRNAEGVGYHTVATGTERECTDAIMRCLEGGAALRLLRPDGTVAKHVEAKRGGAKGEAKRVGGPGKATKPAPIVHRGKPAKTGKPAGKKRKGR